MKPVVRLLQRLAAPLMLAYAPLALAAALMHRAPLAVLGLGALLAGVACVLSGRVGWRGWSLWGVLVALVVLAVASDHQAWLLDAVPVFFNAALAWVFGHTLRAGREPLVARVIRAIEGPSRLLLPGVARYARHVTVFWTVLLGVQALLLAAYWVATSPWSMQPPTLMIWYAHLGGYLLLVPALLGEYVVRRWRLRHIDHPGPGAFMRSLAACWPSLVRGIWA